MSFEIPAAAGVLGADEAGRPRRCTNLRDLANDAALPPLVSHVVAPPGYSHAAPDTHTPYLTGNESLPKETDDE
jgi:hypothetical protein